MLDYDIVNGLSWSDLVVNVRRSMERGWEPQGGVCTAVDKGNLNSPSNNVCFYQAMIRGAKNDN